MGIGRQVFGKLHALVLQLRYDGTSERRDATPEAFDSSNAGAGTRRAEALVTPKQQGVHLAARYHVALAIEVRAIPEQEPIIFRRALVLMVFYLQKEESS